MTKPKTKITVGVQHRERSGMTLIELLVAIAILVIIAAILVPQLRFASADRSVREASRLVASMFAQASQRAVNDGVAGVLIERNPNITDEDTGVAYAATSMFLMRRIPRYIGESVDEEAVISSATSVSIPLPSEQTTLGTIRVGDQISFGNQSQLRFTITALNEAGSNLELTLDLSRFGTPPNNAPPNNTSEFIIYRQPRRLASSRVDLPTGYLVDLRLSGELDTLNNTSFFALDTSAESVTYLFNGRGNIDRFFYTDGGGARLNRFPSQPAYLMVREFNPEENGERIENVLNNDLSMWVTIELTTGAANVIPGVAVDLTNIAPEDLPDAIPNALLNARTIGRVGQAAQ